MRLLPLLCLFGIVVPQTLACHYRICYYRAPILQGIVYPEMVDPSMCSHLIYTHSGVSFNGWIPMFHESPHATNMYQRCINLKKKNPNLKILISIKLHHSTINDARSEWLANAFGYGVTNFLRLNNLDGLDLQWDYRNFSIGCKWFNQNLTNFLQVVRSHFDRDSVDRKKTRLILSAAMTGSHSQECTSAPNSKYHEFSKHLDFVNYQAFHFNIDDKHTRMTHHPSAIYKEKFYRFNVDEMTSYAIIRGIPAHKLVLGIALFGHVYKLNSLKNHAPGASAVLISKYSFFSGEKSMMAYYEICRFLNRGITPGRLKGSPYFSSGNLWVGYDDVTSVTEKMKIVRNLGLGGVMFWSLDYYDVWGKWCKDGRDNIVKAVTDLCLHNKTITSDISSLTYPDKPITQQSPTSQDITQKDISQTELNSLCTNVNDTEPRPNPAVKCFKYLSCFNGKAVSRPCPSLQFYSEQERRCQWVGLNPSCPNIKE